MPTRTDLPAPKAANLASILVKLRARAKLTQSEVAQRMHTTQTAIARLESGRQSPSIETLLSYAQANGYCLQIGFVRLTDGPAAAGAQHGCILSITDDPLLADPA